ncbi:amidohydrolase family protein [Saccharopolyspora rhizosphaerae]|uniref:amidohydrolase family protein n=1 Tax=Saccharopolyspora rhizosphaerae TaxID=2492662 RepID=UPI0013155C85|nr:amidohydrolase family protein [Saccharopolyspora rhizosphaerae]
MSARARISRRTALAAAAASVATAGTATASAGRGLTAGVGAQVFDGRRALGRATVLVEGAHVLAVGPEPVVPRGFEVVDGRGRTLLPGLVDAHIHAPLSADAPRFGTTTELDMFGFLDQLGPYKRLRESTAPNALSDLWSAGTLLTVPGGHGTQFGPIPTLRPEAGRAGIDAFVADRLAEGSDHVKVVREDGSLYGDERMPTLTHEQVAWAVDAAHRRGARCVVHTTTQRDAAAALGAGADGLTHVPGDPLSDEALEVAARSGAFVIATLSVFNGIGCAGAADEVLTDPLIAPLLSQEQRDGLSLDGVQCMPEIFRAASANIGALHRAGVTVLAGTDLGNRGVARGASLLSEIGLLVDAGLPPTAALRAATGAPADRFGLHDRGVLEPGRRADMVLVNGDATRDVRAVRDIEVVWRNGHRIDRTPRDQSGSSFVAVRQALPE